MAERLRIGLAWGVHLFTASGALVGALALVAVDRGDLRAAALWMLLAIAIDSLDGTFARAVGVSRVLPGFDGRRLDDIVDFLNYVIVPCVFLVAGGLVPHWGAVAAPILASCYGFSQVDAKTEDDFFLGFPSYWNVIAIQAWLLEVDPALLAWILAAFSALVFVPLKYVYPSKLRAWRRTTYALTALAAAVVAGSVLDPERARALGLPQLSLAYPAFYLALSLHLGGWLRRRA
ncbi:MAG TPA: CDP-diacylglycerol O-phosphatidyltransferase [Myxococcota bacterium]|nr:CDP-diacylglycerol O-phosphatidyltransferase [Myxococcota bacterium]